MSRVADMPIYEQHQVAVSAPYYNLWRRARLHLKFPLRFSLESYRDLVMIIDNDEWLCADESNNDFPVLCWLDFEDKNRDNLHLPVKCHLNYYHFAAHKIHADILKLIEKELTLLLGNKKVIYPK